MIDTVIMYLIILAIVFSLFKGMYEQAKAILETDKKLYIKIFEIIFMIVGTIVIIAILYYLVSTTPYTPDTHVGPSGTSY